jgi:3-phytase
MRRTLTLIALTTLTVTSAPGPAHAAAPRIHPVTAKAETLALFDDEAGGDADADDPAIWVHPWNRAKSLVVGTAKNGGLRVYDLAGREVQSIAAGEGGRFNNVDIIRYGRQDVAVVTDRGNDKLRFYRIDPRATGTPLVDVTAADAPLLFSADAEEVEEQATGYGLATYGDYAVVSRRHRTRLGIFRLKQQGATISYRVSDTLDLPREFRLPDGTTWTPCAEPGEDPQVEGMVVDTRAKVLYASQEDIGLWRIDLRGGKFGHGRRIVEKVAEFGVPGTYDPETEECTLGADSGYGGRIKADVEGATLYENYLLVSSQGDSRFYAYDRRTNRPLTAFEVVDGKRTDGVQHSDGAAATSTPLPGYPKGLLVLHDGENKPDDGRVSTNFKYVDWRALPLR